jgi:hypothetical protein
LKKPGHKSNVGKVIMKNMSISLPYESLQHRKSKISLEKGYSWVSYRIRYSPDLSLNVRGILPLFLKTLTTTSAKHEFTAISDDTQKEYSSTMAMFISWAIKTVEIPINGHSLFNHEERSLLWLMQDQLVASDSVGFSQSANSFLYSVLHKKYSALSEATAIPVVHYIMTLAIKNNAFSAADVNASSKRFAVFMYWIRLVHLEEMFKRYKL